MDDLSNLSRGLGPAGGAEVGATMGDLAGAIEETGGLDGLVERLRQGGLDDEVDSWVSTGENRAVDPQRLGDALGPETVQRLSNGTGLEIQALLPLLAAFLPQLINMLTPNGRVPDGGLNESLGSGGLGDLGGLLGGLMGGTGGAGTGSLDDLLSGLGGAPGDDKGR
ncbi:MAG TPA: YidB family protein [Candidatus Limnocylindrales bacterium]|jgi:uncharacterized protein YidB (DUF937 family)|nr:YidB family protein [Candidatus Limnocylindrales bacterium]